MPLVVPSRRSFVERLTWPACQRSLTSGWKLTPTVSGLTRRTRCSRFQDCPSSLRNSSKYAPHERLRCAITSIPDLKGNACPDNPLQKEKTLCAAQVLAVNSRLVAEPGTYTTYAFGIRALTLWRSGWQAMRTTRAPESDGNSASWNCCEMVHGMRSPVGDPPCASVASADWRLISPSMHTWTTARTSGSADWDSSTGPERRVVKTESG